MKPFESVNQLSHLLDDAMASVNRIILGKEKTVKLAFCCLLARGHLLLEDIPGMGKTTLSHTLAKVLGLGFQRIQFTSDLLPADILGVSVFNRNTGEFQFHSGPIFSQFILVDEVNRATPKSQSALLEAMEERQVTIEGETRPLPSPFFVVATQNPLYQLGTFALPESQLDRFMMTLSLGYPSSFDERKILKGDDPRSLIGALESSLSAKDVLLLQGQIDKIHASEPLLDYLQALIQVTRDPIEYVQGLSTRGSMALLRAAKAWAFVSGRDHVMPEDLQAVFGAVISHRLKLVESHESFTPEQIEGKILSSVPVV